MNFKKIDSNMNLLGDLNAHTGVSDDFVDFDDEQYDIPYRSNRDKITNTNGRFLLDLAKTIEVSIVNGRIGSEISLV